MRVSTDSSGFRRWLEAGSEDIPAADVQIITSGGRSIPAHSAVLASVSPVLESMLDRPQRRGSSSKSIPILGVPCDAVLAFLRFLYSARCDLGAESGEMEKYGLHLLVLSHVFQVGWLKRACEAGLARRLTAEGVVDVLQLARECDAPGLYLRCMKLLAKDFAAVEQTEAWRFLQAHDPWLELEILQFLQDADLRQRRRRRKREEQGVYMELSEALECLQHIFTEGCTDVGPFDQAPRRSPCARFATCRGLQHLIRHFAACDLRRHRRSCPRCKRMWQVLRLHSSICDQPDPCKVPLCTQFKLKSQQMEGKEEDVKWRVLAKKVAAARVMSSLAKRKREEQLHESFGWSL
ncbi:BTB/POZ and TAZ domain-containing protein 1 [Elaeis guineensis]|uniref:BTB/POZ and TAZ domain-containing protein 1 n=1 Tax=Elaeis guineensis var. tenera TaxID=51953 RepID=A0A6I9S2G6_ELAGV|nr:BTB/POZ and TAZ domain-containing protein 1 [Elaeis guineensis]